MTPLVVFVESLTHAYHSRRGETCVALRDLSLRVQGPVLYGVVGPAGAGKSTLFRILATALQPSSGQALVAGYDVVDQASQVRRHLGAVFQTNSLDRQLTVEQNLRAQGELLGIGGADLAPRLDEVLAETDLAARRRDLVKDLSAGLARRADLAKAMLHRPGIILLDEPTAGLDAHARGRLWESIERIRAARPMAVLVSTEMRDEADRCDRRLRLQDGVKVGEE
ncbi:MAG: ABC transporter ATP-binding protein [Bryobacteraceae bacterium]|nr:ABC transporter ATP-binding protein [Bryobacteraceae bacterium]